MKHLMIDIETMSTHTSEALILSVGAIPFLLKKDGPEFGQPQIYVLDLAPQLLTRRIDKGTVRWWREQTDAARDHWMSPAIVTSPHNLRGQLFLLINSFSTQGEVEIWANGDRFDIANLEHLMWSYAPDDLMPWRYNGVSDYRTQCRWNPQLRQMPLDLKFEGHDPIEDCKKQIWRLWEVATEKMMEP